MDAEILRVLTVKFSWSPERVRAALALPIRTVRIKLVGKVKACHDPYDDMFLECAWLAKAHFLVAGDKDLLTLGSYRSTRIMTPAQYVNGFPLPT
jgi:predicted nucleic acid-binding protein